jgi:hypothetical protein
VGVLELLEGAYTLLCQLCSLQFSIWLAAIVIWSTNTIGIIGTSIVVQ